MKRNLIYLSLFLVCVLAFGLFLTVTKARTDAQPPTISFAEGPVEFSATAPRATYLQGVTAWDDRDGDVTASVVVADVKLLDPDGSIRITYAAFDAAGNVTKASREAKFTDYESPKFTSDQSLTFASGTNFDLFKLIGAQDVLDGDISHRVRINSLDESTITATGIHNVELRVTNSLGETTRLVIPVEVYAAGTYTAKLTLTEYMVYLPVGEVLDENAYLDTFLAGNSSLSLADGLPENCTLDVINQVETDVPGVYTVEYRVSQRTGNATVTGYAKLIVVVEG